MELSLNQIAEHVGGRLTGGGDLRIRGVATVEMAKEGDITFLAHPRYADQAVATMASAIIVKTCPDGVHLPMLFVSDPHWAFAQLLSVFYPPLPRQVGIDPRAVVDAAAQIGSDVFIGPCAVVECDTVIGSRVDIGAGAFIGQGSRIGEETVIHPNVVIGTRVTIGCRVILHAGCVIGSDGFGFIPYQGRHQKVPQVGGVTVEDDVEIGANVTIDRATLGQTVVGRGTKIDNLVQIGHNVKIGEDCLIVAQVGISGSVSIGSRVVLAGQVGVVGHLSIGEHTVVAARSVVTKDIPANSRVAGFPAMPHQTWLKATVSLPHLPDFRKQLKVLEERLEQMENYLSHMAEKQDPP